MCVLDDEASREVLSSDDMDAAVEGKTLILTMIEPAESRALEAWARDRRAHYLDGAILAYPSDVREGTGNIVYSGSKDVFDSRQHILGSLGGKPIFVSEQAGRAPGAATMTSDLDIYRTASGLIHEHGEDAALEAAQRADAMLEKGAIDGQRVWKRVLKAIKEIQRQEPREGEAVN